MRKSGEHSVEWGEISPNSIRTSALRIFLLLPQILYELWEKKIEFVETMESMERFEAALAKAAAPDVKK